MINPVKPARPVMLARSSPPPKFTGIARNADGTITLVWTGDGELQTASTFKGPWTPVGGATSPFTITPMDPMWFARVHVLNTNIYSVNAVGYVNINLVSGCQIVANPLHYVKAERYSMVQDLFEGAPDGTVIYKYMNGAYLPGNGYTSTFGWDNPDQTLMPGEAAWICLPTGTAKTITFVGEVPQGVLMNFLPKGFALVSSMWPQNGKIQSDLGYPVQDGDIIYTFSNATGYEVFMYDSYFGGWMHEGNPEEPYLQAGEGFWSYKSADKVWKRDFSVQ